MSKRKPSAKAPTLEVRLANLEIRFGNLCDVIDTVEQRLARLEEQAKPAVEQEQASPQHRGWIRWPW